MEAQHSRWRFQWVFAWASGATLILVLAPLVRSTMPLSDELDLGSIVMPVWTFLQLCLLTGVLAWLRPRTAGWAVIRRALVSFAAALAVGMFQPSILSLVSRIGDKTAIPLDRDPLQVALLWSTPLLFYVIPAGLVTADWMRSRTFRPSRILGTALVALGLLNIAAIFWFKLLWSLYVNQ